MIIECVMRYVSQMYHVFEANNKAGSGIANISVNNPTLKPSQTNTSTNNTTNTATNTSKALPATPSSNNAPPAVPPKPNKSSLNMNTSGNGSGGRVLEEKAEMSLTMNNKKVNIPV